MATNSLRWIPCLVLLGPALALAADFQFRPDEGDLPPEANLAPPPVMAQPVVSAPSQPQPQPQGFGPVPLVSAAAQVPVSAPRQALVPSPAPAPAPVAATPPPATQLAETSEIEYKGYRFRTDGDDSMIESTDMTLIPRGGQSDQQEVPAIEFRPSNRTAKRTPPPPLPAEMPEQAPTPSPYPSTPGLAPIPGYIPGFHSKQHNYPPLGYGYGDPWSGYPANGVMGYPLPLD